LTVGRALERLHVVRRDAQVLEPQRLQRLEAEDVPDDRGRHVRDRSLLEQIEVVGDPRDVLLLGAGHGLDRVRLRLVVPVVGQPIGPHHRPGRRGGLAGDRGGGLQRLDTGLRRDAERRQDVAVLWLIVGVVVTHLRVRRDARGPAVLLRLRPISVGPGHRPSFLVVPVPPEATLQFRRIKQFFPWSP
jgi:hypothetical protein